MHAIIKYRSELNKRKELLENDAELLQYFRQQLARDNFLAPDMKKGRQLKKSELAELLKYFNKPELCQKVQSIKFPAFFNIHLDQHEILVNGEDESARKRVKLSELDSKKSKIRFNVMLSDLKEKWIESNFELSEKQLLETINQNLISKYTIVKPNM
jgi:hypothetical protein